jgi:hypothetical protein
MELNKGGLSDYSGLWPPRGPEPAVIKRLDFYTFLSFPAGPQIGHK